MRIRPAKRKYRESELPLWFERVGCDWEKCFSAKELEYGRALYKSGCVREVELNTSEAFITARLEDGSEPFCIVDFDGAKFAYIPTSSADPLYGALKVAGFYEIEEFIIDTMVQRELSLDFEGSDGNSGGADNVCGGAAREGSQESESGAEVSGSGGVPSDVESAAESGGAARGTESDRALAVNFSSKRKGLVFQVFWRDGDRRVPAFGEKSPAVEDLTRGEGETLMYLVSESRKAGFKFEDNMFVLSDITKISPFLNGPLKKWKKHFAIRKDAKVDLLMLGERQIELSARARHLGADSEDFDIDWLPSVGGRAIERDDISKIFNGKSSVQILPDYGIVSISGRDSDFVRNVERAREYGFADGKIPKYMLLALSEFGENLLLSDELREWVDTLVKTSDSAKNAQPEFLRNYQKKAVCWAENLFGHGCNAMIADEMGLGKTIQTLALFNAFLAKPSVAGADGKFLVVCPASVIPVWISETKKFFPKIEAKILTSKTAAVGGGILVASYTQLRRNKALIDSATFDVAVLDEAQFIKNPDSKTTAACMAIKAKHKLALTGTPVENRLLDMWTSFRWLMPGLMGSRKRFEELAQNSNESVGLVRRQISPFVLRRLKSEVARELPEKIFIDLLCPMSEVQKSEYAALLGKAREELASVAEGNSADEASKRWTVLSLLTRLRQTCCDARLLPWLENAPAPDVGGKISVLSDRVQELILGGKKVLVFSQFTKFLSLIRAKISEFVSEDKIFTLTGNTRDRSKPVDSFQNAKDGVVMLVSLRAGGTGITLTNADYVFLADPWWNPAVEEQAIDRVHRIGRRADVFVYRLLSQGTVEDRVRQLQSEKKTLFNDLLGDLKDVSNNGRFMETIRDILG